MSDISNTNGAGDAENVAKVSRFYINFIFLNNGCRIN